MPLNINDLREALEEQLKAVRDGSGDLRKSKEVRNITNEYCKTIKLEMAYYKDKGQKPSLPNTFLPVPETDESKVA